MSAPSQLDLLSLSPAVSRSRRKQGHVPRTSVLAYREADVTTRESWCLNFLRSHLGEEWTSAEIAHNYLGEGMERLMFVRRGLSDLKARGAVEHVPHGERTCRVGGKRAVTWRVVGR